MEVAITLRVNGTEHRLSVDTRTTLLQAQEPQRELEGRFDDPLPL